MSLADLRRDYALARFDENDAHANPFEQFRDWFETARTALQDSASWEPNAMTLATVDADGRPSARIVLLKGVDDGAFVFYTNYLSRKGVALAHNPYAALVFYWNVLERQVRVEGRVEVGSAEENDRYFASRPLASRLGAIASPQSEVIASRAELETRMTEVQAVAGDDPPRPDHWGGYRLRPDRLEFWQGRQSRLHDRILYQRDGNGGWEKMRLAP
jgi:pyridoxamine 5'-phosphate oxidase